MCDNSVIVVTVFGGFWMGRSCALVTIMMIVNVKRFKWLINPSGCLADALRLMGF